MALENRRHVGRSQLRNRALVLVAAFCSALWPSGSADGFTDSGEQEIPPPSCAITTPPEIQFAPPKPYASKPAARDTFWYGSDGLWTRLPNDGQWRGLRTESGYRTQLMLWRKGFDWRFSSATNARITARRVGDVAPALIARQPSGAYAPDIGSAMITLLDFPSPGCWEVNASYDESRLRFVIYVPR